MPPRNAKPGPPPKLGPRPATKDHLVSGKKRVVVKHAVVLDNELSDRLVEARTAYELAEALFKAKPSDASREEEFKAAEATYRAAQEAAAEVTVEVTMRGLGRAKFDLLKRQYPPTPQDVKDAERVGIKPEQVEFSYTTFPPAIIAACMVDPETNEPMMSPEEVKAGIWDADGYNETETQGIYLAAMKANQVRATVDLGKAFGATSASG
ncbi:MAG: hypothetical protein LC798_16815 [Chloroflexi bacterium]|nr:hypothetical protein [Chloroflexota bacterium]